jgi:hypothetical protein
MRTTLTIDDAIAKALKDLAHRSSKPFKEVVNETLRAGLNAPAAGRSKRYKVKPAALGGVLPGINLDKALALADAIEDQELATKMPLRECSWSTPTCWSTPSIPMRPSLSGRGRGWSGCCPAQRRWDLDRHPSVHLDHHARGHHAAPVVTPAAALA